LPSLEELRRTDVNLDEFIAFEHNWYDGSIRGMNAEIGRVMERLRELGLDEKTLVIFLSDHGEEFLDHGYPFHGQSVYSELTHVPLAFRWPGVITPGQRVDEPVQLIDVMPTLLSFCGLPAPKEVQGQSLLPLIRSSHPPSGPNSTWKSVPVISERQATAERGSAPIPHDLESYAIRWEGWKLIHNVHRHDDRPEFELFDQKQDLLDKHNLAAEHPERVKALSKMLAAWKEKTLTFQLKPDSELEQQLSPDEAQRLRALGYLGGGTAPTNKAGSK
jgi:arylsulfatase A-like enzyme